MKKEFKKMRRKSNTIKCGSQVMTIQKYCKLKGLDKLLDRIYLKTRERTLQQFDFLPTYDILQK